MKEWKQKLADNTILSVHDDDSKPTFGLIWLQNPYFCICVNTISIFSISNLYIYRLFSMVNICHLHFDVVVLWNPRNSFYSKLPDLFFFGFSQAMPGARMQCAVSARANPDTFRAPAVKLRVQSSTHHAAVLRSALVGRWGIPHYTLYREAGSWLF